jgi:serine/threonine-protein kinase
MTPQRWGQLEELYRAARALSPSERTALLERADLELRATVAAILAQEDAPDNGDTPGEDGAFLDRPAWEGRESLLKHYGPLHRETPVGVGAQLGPYRLEQKIGEGGMGTVYRATDTRLDRSVAIKISGGLFDERFEREARAISALNHPHICTLHDIGADYMVMELVEGETMAARIRKGALPVRDVLGYGAQIAGALAAAHVKNITHRDLKPTNIMIAKNGVKVLDFGLAKCSTHDGTITRTGVVMGTPAYMAPEQLEGKRVDARTDIFALGHTLYEMATGKRMAPGQPPAMEGLPERLTHVIERCLEPEPENRWQSARDVKAELEWAAKQVQAPEKVSGLPKAGAQTIGKRRPWPWILLSSALALVAGVAIWAPWRHDPAMQIGEPLVRIDADLGTGVSLFTENGPALALSHDGARVAFSSRTEEGSMRLYWRRLDQATATPLPGTESAFSPFFSPNGEYIAFFAEGWLKKIELATGNVTVLANAVNPSGGSWGEDGVIVFHRAPSLDLWTVAANGGSLTKIPRPAGESQHVQWPQLLPGGKTLLVTGVTGLGGNVDQATVKTISLEDGHSRTLVEGAHFGRYLSSGHLAYLRHGTLFVRAFDAARQGLTGPEIPLLQGVEYSSLNGAGQFDIAANGTLIYRAAHAGSNLKTVQWMDRTGRLEPLLETPGDYRAISLSPDGKRLAIVNADTGGSDLYVYDLQRHLQPVRLTVGANIRLEGGGPRGLAWNPDGRYLFFAADNGTWWVPTEGLSQARELIEPFRVSTISHDGTRMFAEAGSEKTRGDAWIVPLSIGRNGPQAGRPQPLLHESYTEVPFFDSPDGRWLAYSTDETGISQSYVMEVANPARKWMVNGGSNGQQAGWSPSGREIFFTTFFAPLRIVAASLSFEGGVVHPGQPHPWSPAAIPNHAGEGVSSITMAPDGKRFAVLMPVERPLGNRVTFVMNFFDEVRRRTAPVK